MCAACVAQGVVYVGGALTGLQVMAARARNRRPAARPAPEGAEPVELTERDLPVETDGAPPHAREGARAR